MREATTKHTQAVKDLREAGITHIWVCDYKAAQAMRGWCRHCRSGKLSRHHPASQRREAEPYTLLAFGCDELGNTVAITTRGVRQFI